jgi:hypothetical protein
MVKGYLRDVSSWGKPALNGGAGDDSTSELIGLPQWPQNRAADVLSNPHPLQIMFNYLMTLMEGGRAPYRTMA